jgi:DNA-binding transcriptional LysR family regulator
MQDGPADKVTMQAEARPDRGSLVWEGGRLAARALREGLETKHLRYFVAVAEEEHLGRAADRLNVAASAVSRRIQDLEADLGVELFERLPRGIRLTAAGHDFLDSAREILNLMVASRDRMRRFAAGPAGHLILAHGDALTYVARPLVDSLMALQAKLPGISFELRLTATPEREVQLLDGSIDAALVHAKPRSDRQLDGRLIGTAPYVAFVAKDMAEAWGEAIPIAQLTGVTLVMWPRLINPGTYDTLLSLLARGGYRPETVTETFDTEAIFALVAKGNAVHIGPALLPQIPRTVAPVTLADLDLQLENWLIWRRGHLSPTLASLLDTLAKDDAA